MSFPIDSTYLKNRLLRFLGIHSPTGYTDPIVRAVCEELDELRIDYEITRRGAIRATLHGEAGKPKRAVVTHLDTLGAMVRSLKPNGRLEITPVGTWSARFAEGARVSIFADEAIYRGTVLPLKASGHTFGDEVDTQPVSWENVEVRIDEPSSSLRELLALGIQVGDIIGFDSCPELLPNGYINSRHLDDKAGVAAVLAAARYIRQSHMKLPGDLFLLFTISEEVGSGASSILHGDIAEMVTVDNGTVAPGQSSSEFGVTIAMADSSGPFDWHLTRHLLMLCDTHLIEAVRDVFRYYRCDSASAVEAGNDLRTALATFGVDSSHGYERTNLSSLHSIAQLIVAYAAQPLHYEERSKTWNDSQWVDLESFPETRTVNLDLEVHEKPEEEEKPTPPNANGVSR